MKQRLPALKPKSVLRALTRAGFLVDHITGGHYILRHPQRPGLRVTIPFHNRDLKRKTLSSIIEQSGYTPEEFLDLL
jgi:predicted RNA binding protein YcfA (HicA-like mRNA interferase family)